MKELAAEKADDSRLTVAGSFLLSRKVVVLSERKALEILGKVIDKTIAV